MLKSSALFSLSLSLLSASSLSARAYILLHSLLRLPRQQTHPPRVVSGYCPRAQIHMQKLLKLRLNNPHCMHCYEGKCSFKLTFAFVGWSRPEPRP